MPLDPESIGGLGMCPKVTGAFYREIKFIMLLEPNRRKQWYSSPNSGLWVCEDLG